MEILEAFDHARVEELLAHGERFWLRLRSPEPATLHELGELLGLNPLAVEDSLQFGQRPKIDDYPGSALLVLYGARLDISPQGGDQPVVVPTEFHFHVTAQAIVSVRREDAAGADVRRRIGLDDVDTAEDVLYRVLDAVVDSWYGPLEQLDAEIDRIEDAVLAEAGTDQRLRLLQIKHSLVRVRQTVSAQRDVLAGRREVLEMLPGFDDPRAHESLRDIYDRISLVSQQVDSVREAVSNALDLYVSAVANRLNEIMKVLTIVATFFLPLTFVTGYFGQNFAWMVRNVDSAWAFALLGLALNAAIVAGLWAWFVRAGFIQPRRRAARPGGRREP